MPCRRCWAREPCILVVGTVADIATRTQWMLLKSVKNETTVWLSHFTPRSVSEGNENPSICISRRHICLVHWILFTAVRKQKQPWVSINKRAQSLGGRDRQTTGLPNWPTSLAYSANFKPMRTLLSKKKLKVGSAWGLSRALWHLR